jgi:hypothetical protein
MSALLYWSDKMERLFSDQVIAPVRDHPNTDFTENIHLGFPFDLIRGEVIEKGLADFGTGYSHPLYGTLSADEKVLLYSFINFKKQLQEALLCMSDGLRDLPARLSALGWR